MRCVGAGRVVNGGPGARSASERFMAMQNRQFVRRLAIALAIAVVALPLPAGAQFFGPKTIITASAEPPAAAARLLLVPLSASRRRRPIQSVLSAGAAAGRSFKRRRRASSYAAGLHRHGDRRYDGRLARYGLEDVLSDTPDVGVVRNIRPTSGLIRYDAKNDSLECRASSGPLVNEKPSAIVSCSVSRPAAVARQGAAEIVAAGRANGAAQAQSQNQDKAAQPPVDAAKPDGEQPPVAASEPPRQGPAGSYDFHTDKWRALRKAHR